MITLPLFVIVKQQQHLTIAHYLLNNTTYTYIRIWVC